MPKLSKKLAKAAASADIATGDFPLIDPGWYFAQLESVEVRDGNYAPQWNATFVNMHSEVTGARISGKQWYRMNIVPEGDAPPAYPNGDKKWANWQKMSLGMLRNFFEAFGYTTDSDTDELQGEWTRIKITIRTINAGARKGEKINDVKTVGPVPDDFDPTTLGTEDDEEDANF